MRKITPIVMLAFSVAGAYACIYQLKSEPVY
jgi:hypothetical protein